MCEEDEERENNKNMKSNKTCVQIKHSKRTRFLFIETEWTERDVLLVNSRY